MVQKSCQMREQCVPNELAGAGACQDYIKVIACDHLIDKLPDLIFVLSDLSACLFPCCWLLIDLSQRKC